MPRSHLPHKRNGKTRMATATRSTRNKPTRKTNHHRQRTTRHLPKTTIPKRRNTMTLILFYHNVRAKCKHVFRRKNKPFLSFAEQNKRLQRLLNSQIQCLQIARKNVKKVLKGDFYGLRGCCRVCEREYANPKMNGFRKWRDRLRWVCLCFECKCRRCKACLW